MTRLPDAAVAERLRAVRDRLDEAVRRSGRKAGTVKLVAVSKRHPGQSIREAYEAGQRAFGENYVQELESKAQALKDLVDIEWHLIGGLQRNKAKVVARIADVVHTVDSLRLVSELNRRLELENRRVDAFIQVNVADEDQKRGCGVAELAGLIDAMRASAHLGLAGLMTIPPANEEPSRHFERLAELAAVHKVEGLSMGMSADLDEAVQAGATVVRVGTAIFGPRP